MGLPVTALCLWLTAPATALGVPYEIRALGFTDAEHTRDDGYRRSFAFTPQNAVGQVAGFSTRYEGADSHGRSAWLADGGTLTRIGFWDAEHTRDDGYQSSDPRGGVTPDGRVVGFSHRYIGADAAGHSAWQYGGGSTTRLGFWDAGHTRDDGYQYSANWYQNEAGQVVGFSSRFAGADPIGQSAWQYTGGVTTRVGFWDVDHTRDDGRQQTHVSDQSASGQLIGFSQRYAGAAGAGESAWLYQGGATTRLGFTDAEHTYTSGTQSSRPLKQNEAGQVIGYSRRYEGAGGTSAWLYGGGATTRLGFIDADHTRDDGYQLSWVSFLNEAGQVTGHSDRYAGAIQTGRSAWQYGGGTTTRIGLWDGEHTGDTGRQSSMAAGQNEAGQVIGTSQRYAGAASAGESAWQYGGGTATRIGFTDAEHTRADGYQRSNFLSFPDFGAGGGARVPQNEAGQVVGTSQRFSGTEDAGWSVWQYSGGAVTRMGVTDPRHTRDDGYRYSENQEQNGAGQVIGFSQRYIGSDEAGQTAWFFDSGTGISFGFDLSERSDGYAYSDFAFLGEDGLGLGSYTLFDASDADLGRRAFGFTLDEGFFDLGELVDGGLGAAGWASLSRAWNGNGAGQILGQGFLDDPAASSMVFQLTPGAASIPGPAGVSLMLVGLAGLALTRYAGRRPRTRP